VLLLFFVNEGTVYEVSDTDEHFSFMLFSASLAQAELAHLLFG
jgi:hypothetical protein